MQGWEPRTVTDHSYDDTGRLVQTVSYTEPEFSEDDVALLLEFVAQERERGPHGHPMSEATSSLGNRKNRDGKWFYSARLVTDFAREAMDDAREALESGGGKVPNGAFWVVEKHDR